MLLKIFAQVGVFGPWAINLELNQLLILSTSNKMVKAPHDQLVNNPIHND